MRFGPVPATQSEGGIVAHAVRLKGRMLKKGHVLGAADVAALVAGGVEEVVIARLEAGDVHEDAAALAVAGAVAGTGLTLGKAFTGRCNLFAAARGLAVVDVARLDRLNLVDEGVTVATVAPHVLVEPGTMVATVKIIPFAVPHAVLERCLAAAREGGPMVRVAGLRGRDVGLVLTRLPGTKEKVLDSTREAVAARLAALGCRLAGEVRCAHATDAVAATVRELEAKGCAMVLVYGASAITDRRDVIPSAVEAVGGTIVHLGMPVDPGNLLLLGRHGEVPVLGLPGCARSLKLNGFDWVLERLVADLEIAPADIMRMGAGGLLMETPKRGLPRADASPAAGPVATAAPRVVALVLAAGQSRRMGPVNKLTADVDGRPMVARAVDAALASGARPVIVVTGHEADKVRAALAGKPVTFVHNPDYAEGLSTSLVRGIDAVPAEADGAVVCLGDMPRVSGALIDRLIAAFNPLEGRSVVVPTFRGKRGNPVVWARRHFAGMRRLAGDVGARHLIGENEDQVAEVEGPDDAVLHDVDTPEALARLSGAA